MLSYVWYLQLDLCSNIRRLLQLHTFLGPAISFTWLSAPYSYINLVRYQSFTFFVLHHSDVEPDPPRAGFLPLPCVKTNQLHGAEVEADHWWSGWWPWRTDPPTRLHEIGGMIRVSLIRFRPLSPPKPEPDPSKASVGPASIRRAVIRPKDMVGHHDQRVGRGSVVFVFPPILYYVCILSHTLLPINEGEWEGMTGFVWLVYV